MPYVSVLTDILKFPSALIIAHRLVFLFQQRLDKCGRCLPQLRNGGGNNSNVVDP